MLLQMTPMCTDRFVLPDIAPVTLTGGDAARFAQAQFMNDVAALPSGHWHWNGWLTPKGRVIALFALIKRAEDDLVLLLLDADPARFCSALARFVFRSKVKLAPCPALSVSGCFAAPGQAVGNRMAKWGEGGLELDFSAQDGTRTLLLARTESSPLPRTLHPDSIPESSAAFLVDAWCRFDLAHGLPRFNPGQAEHWTAQQLSLDRLAAYSVKKGCYPGQEIVARTHFLGQAKRGLVRLVARQPIAPETGVQVDEAPPVPLVARCEHEALAVLSLDTAPGARYRIGIHSVERKPLLDGLGR